VTFLLPAGNIGKLPGEEGGRMDKWKELKTWLEERRTDFIKTMSNIESPELYNELNERRYMVDWFLRHMLILEEKEREEK